MPMFEFRCRGCGARFEELVRSAAVTVACPKCRETGVEKLFSAFAVGTGGAAAEAEPGPCGACGAAERGMCAME